MAFDTPPDGGAELAVLLERSGVDFRREGNRFSFRFARGGCQWQTVCDCREELVLVYGIHPAPVGDRPGALALCSRLNARVVRGAFSFRRDTLSFAPVPGWASSSTPRSAQPRHWNTTPPPSPVFGSSWRRGPGASGLISRLKYAGSCVFREISSDNFTVERRGASRSTTPVERRDVKQ